MSDSPFNSITKGSPALEAPQERRARMTAIDTIRRTLLTHTPAGKDKRHDGCACFAEALESLARVEAVIEAVRAAKSMLTKGEDTPIGNVIMVADAWGELDAYLSNLSPSTPVSGQDA